VSDVLVLCYHAVSPMWPAPLSVTPDSLERQLTHLVRRGWRSAGFRDAVLNPSAPRTLSITFDDAFASVKELAYPILASLGLSATVFVPTEYVTEAKPLAWEGMEHWAQTEYASELTPMSWEELGSLHEAGWEIGSHTRTHPRLTRVDDVRLEMELTSSREECARALGHPCDTIAYPYGDVDERVADHTRRAGYRAAGALPKKLVRLGSHRWPRVGIYRVDTTRRFQLKVARPMRELRASPLWPR
jgi:peptidoglycan/xylan/chitin deacetylase (PgdA/CDA1 family)